jgi:hypothetical protein
MESSLISGDDWREETREDSEELAFPGSSNFFAMLFVIDRWLEQRDVIKLLLFFIFKNVLPLGTCSKVLD